MALLTVEFSGEHAMAIDRKSKTEQRWRDIIKDYQKSWQSIRCYYLMRGISEGVVG